MTHVTVIDGYIDEPGSLGVPPYVHPLVRAVYGAAKDAGAEPATIPSMTSDKDGIREGRTS